MSLQVKNGIDILTLAIENNISASKAAAELGFRDAYLGDVKRRIESLLENRSITLEDYNKFKSLVSEYAGVEYIDKILEEEEEPSEAEYNGKSEYTKGDTKSKIIDDFDEKRSYTHIVRDDNGKIEKYQYTIHVRDEDPLVGELTRSQMETIYAYYPYVTMNNCSSYFPALTFINFKKILRVFNITKDRLFAQHLLEEKSEEEIADLALKNKYHASAKKLEERRPIYIEKTLRDTQKELFELKEDRAFIEKLVDKCYNSRTSKFIDVVKPTIKNYNKNVGYSLFSDIHFGKKFDAPVFGRGYNKDIAHDRMIQIAMQTVDYCLTHKISKLNLIFFGDLLESLMPELMHSGHSQQMDMLEDEQLFFAIDSIEEAIKYIFDKISNQCEIKFTAIGGNHDRVLEKRDQDKNRTAAKIAFKVIQRDLKGLVEVVIPEDGLIRLIDNGICLIGHHGDSGLMKRKPAELVNLYGVGTQGYHLIVSGHFHRTKIDMSTNLMEISLPSVCSVDEYILGELGLHNLPGFILGKENSYVRSFDYQFVNLY